MGGIVEHIKQRGSEPQEGEPATHPLSKKEKKNFTRDKGKLRG